MLMMGFTSSNVFLWFFLSNDSDFNQLSEGSNIYVMACNAPYPGREVTVNLAFNVHPLSAAGFQQLLLIPCADSMPCIAT